MLRKLLLSLIALLLLVPSGVAMAINGTDDKKDDKKDKDKEVHKPVLIVVYVPAWNPVMRAIPLQDAANNYYSVIENDSL